jgi:cholera toxin transcriptional activator
VPETSYPKRLFRFGIFELDATTGDLRKGGKSRPRLQGQPLEVLLHLLEHREEVVTRESLRQLLWPADTFVDYDHSLNAAINKLREALSDSADNPRFIQTIPRRGYRFIGSVEASDTAPNPGAQSDSRSPTATADLEREGTSPRRGVTTTGVLSESHDLPEVQHATVRLLFSLIQVMYLCFYVAALAYLHRLESVIPDLVPRPTWLAEWVFVLLTVSALAGIPVRLYLLSAAAFGYSRLTSRFLTLFPALFLLDELWALTPLLLAGRIGTGLALAATAALLYVPFSQRSLLLMSKANSRAAERQ